ncbi:hypothetical protein GCM10010390_07790 [Streptomyces mordarskii]|uniref:Uncharacterized protein n=1 Tax=Streptomyces mordarskii TaxID=1226758 RepID=A0ABP3LU21_9ACTN
MNADTRRGPERNLGSRVRSTVPSAKSTYRTGKTAVSTRAGAVVRTDRRAVQRESGRAGRGDLLSVDSTRVRFGVHECASMAARRAFEGNVSSWVECVTFARGARWVG